MEKRDQHGRDDGGGAHAGEAGAQPRAGTGQKANDEGKHKKTSLFHGVPDVPGDFFRNGVQRPLLFGGEVPAHGAKK